MSGDDGAADLVFFSFVQPLTWRAPPMEGKKRKGEKRPGAAYASAHPSMLSLRCVALNADLAILPLPTHLGAQPVLRARFRGVIVRAHI